MIPDYLDTGAEIVLYIQNLGNWLTLPMLISSYLGSEWFYLLIAPVIYWCINASMGLRMGIYLSISAGVNAILKILFHTPRPYWYDRRVAALSAESSFGIPSGHAQNSVVLWGSLAASIRTKWAWIVTFVLCFLIGLSRIYLGVHFMTDVLVGWLVGALLLWILLKFEPRVLRWLSQHNLTEQFSAVFLASLLLILVGYLARTSLNGWEVPLEWIENARAAAPDAELIDPLSLTGMVSNAALLFGFSAGGIWINTRGGFAIFGTWWQLLLRYILGLIGVLLFWYGLGEILPEGEALIKFVMRYIRYALVGFWVSGLAPYIFIKLRLSEIPGE